MQKSADEFWDRYYPLIESVEGWKGVILNVGWKMDYVMEWRESNHQGKEAEYISRPGRKKTLYNIKKIINSLIC
jgi:hypothetical protein